MCSQTPNGALWTSAQHRQDADQMWMRGKETSWSSLPFAAAARRDCRRAGHSTALPLATVLAAMRCRCQDVREVFHRRQGEAATAEPPWVPAGANTLPCLTWPPSLHPCCSPRCASARTSWQRCLRAVTASAHRSARACSRCVQAACHAVPQAPSKQSQAAFTSPLKKSGPYQNLTAGHVP